MMSDSFMKKPITIGVYKHNFRAEIPTLATFESACFDIRATIFPGQEITVYTPDNEKRTIFAVSPTMNRADGTPPTTYCSSFSLSPGHRALVPTGLIMDIPIGYSIRIHPRSGLAIKRGLTLINAEGVIDSDYVHEFFLTIYNVSNVSADIVSGNRMAQGELVKNLSNIIFKLLDEAPGQKTDRAGGFGHTGI
jgi:dUTP pyrophosphatase